MKITGPVSSSGIRTSRPKGKRTEGGDFRKAMENASGGEESAKPVELSSGVAGVLAAQEIGGEEEHDDEETLKRGGDMLDLLEELRLKLLLGAVPASLLREIGQTLPAMLAKTYDPSLREIMKDIELRAAVELAKLEKLNKRSS